MKEIPLAKLNPPTFTCAATLAKQFNCSKDAILARAKVRNITPTKIGRTYFFTQPQIKKLENVT